MKSNDLKVKQLSLILKYNPMLDDYHTGIRHINDIKTFDEAYNEALYEKEKYNDEQMSTYPDNTDDLLNNALKTDRITIYSSKPIEIGTFVTPSKMMANDYSGDDQINSLTVRLTDVAWINVDEGQYAPINKNINEDKIVFFTENQFNFINENKWNIDPKKVLLVKKYLDKGFKRGSYNSLGEDGYPKQNKIVAMLSTNGEVLKNMTATQLFYLLQDRFNSLFSDKKQRDAFLKKIIKEWYEKRISKNGLISSNYY